MDLKEFISKTISDIMGGIDDASINLKDKEKEVGLSSMGTGNQRHVEFDVAVTASSKDGSETSVGGKIKVWSILQGGVSNKETIEKLNSAISRIKFGVRIKDIKKDDQRNKQGGNIKPH